MNQTKADIERQQKQIRLEQRELEMKRKKDKEEIDKMRGDELVKMRKEKRMIEQRTKSMHGN